MISPHIFCIVVTYNGAKWVKQCFGSLMQSSLPVHVLAIDNASTDNTTRLIRDNFPEVEIMPTGSNLGFGKANNIGLKICLERNADYVFLLNQDAWVEKDCIGSLVKSLTNYPHMGVLSPVHLNAAGTDFDNHFETYVNGADCPGFLTDRFFDRQKDMYPVKFINAAAWMLPVKTVAKVGGFDPLFSHYGEDHDYIERVHYAGFKVGIDPFACIHHDATPIKHESYQYDSTRMKIHHLVQLKKMNNTYRSNWLSFMKSEWDIQTTMLLFRKFKNFWFRCKTSAAMFSHYSRIKKAREKSRETRAFLK